MIELTFEQFVAQHQHCSLQDPVDRAMVPLQQFLSIYASLLQQLDGSDMMGYVTFFYQQSPINRQNWEFVDDDAQQDFQEWAVEIGCIPPLKTLQRGDDYCAAEPPALIAPNQRNRKDRQTKQEQRLRQQAAAKKRAPLSQTDLRKNLEAAKSKLEDELRQCTDTTKKERLLSKLDRIVAKLVEMRQ